MTAIRVKIENTGDNTIRVRGIQFDSVYDKDSSDGIDCYEEVIDMVDYVEEDDWEEYIVEDHEVLIIDGSGMKFTNEDKLNGVVFLTKAGEIRQPTYSELKAAQKSL